MTTQNMIVAILLLILLGGGGFFGVRQGYYTPGVYGGGFVGLVMLLILLRFLGVI